MNIIEQLTTAAEIINTYSDGMLPRPHYVSVCGTINMLVDSPEAVQRWAESVDTAAQRQSTDDGKQIHYTLFFKHNDFYVEVFHVEYVEEPASV